MHYLIPLVCFLSASKCLLKWTSGTSTRYVRSLNEKTTYIIFLIYRVVCVFFFFSRIWSSVEDWLLRNLTKKKGTLWTRYSYVCMILRGNTHTGIRSIASEPNMASQSQQEAIEGCVVFGSIVGSEKWCWSFDISKYRNSATSYRTCFALPSPLRASPCCISCGYWTNASISQKYRNRIDYEVYLFVYRFCYRIALGYRSISNARLL